MVILLPIVAKLFISVDFMAFQTESSHFYINQL